MKKCKNLFLFIHHCYRKWSVWWIILITHPVFADRNPFPSLSLSSGNVIQDTGTHMESALKYSLIGGGGLLILICLGVIVHRMREDSREKDHGNLIMTFILLALGLTIGFVLIGVGWTAFSAQVQS
jgi:hypothetical protein